MQYPKRCDPPPLAPKEETKYGQTWKRNTAKYGNETQPNVETKYGQVWKRRRSLRRFELKVN